MVYFKSQNSGQRLDIKSVQARDEEDFGDDVAPVEDGEEDTANPSSGLPWEGSDRDYTYDELLGALTNRDVESSGHPC